MNESLVIIGCNCLLSGGDGVGAIDRTRFKKNSFEELEGDVTLELERVRFPNEAIGKTLIVCFKISHTKQNLRFPCD